MTIVEFFDTNSIENIVSAMLCRPEKVIFVGYNKKRMQRFIDIYRDVLSKRDIDVDFSYRVAGRNNLEGIVETLMNIIMENEDCVFDLDGGEDLYLVGVGIAYERSGRTVKLQRFNISNNSLTDCDADGSVLQSSPAEISVEENIKIYAGRIIESFTNGFEWDLSEEFLDDMQKMWEINKKNPKNWNEMSFALSALGKDFFDSEDNRVVINSFTVGSAWKLKAGRIERFMLGALEDNGLIYGLIYGHDELTFTFKSEQVKKCIIKAGQLLELYITVAARKAKDDRGRPVYNDVQTGLVLDWDVFDVQDMDKPERITTINEIDLILMKGLVPVFVSCKNGSVDVGELYKLSSVAERFGGKYAKKVLVISDLDRSNDNYKYILSRAEDMRINIIDDVAELSDGELEDKIATMWLGK